MFSVLEICVDSKIQTRRMLVDAKGIQTFSKKDTFRKSESRVLVQFPRAGLSKLEPTYTKRQDYTSKEEILMEHLLFHVSLNPSLNP